MKLNKEYWTPNDYQEFLSYLNSKVDSKYLSFHQNLIPNKEGILGVRVPELKNIAKEISNGDYKSFIQMIQHSTYEETTIHGLILGYTKMPFKELLIELEQFIPFVDNWATNDVVCANLKVFKKNQEEGFQEIQNYLKSKNPWKIRFGLVLLLDHYINDTYINPILTLSDQVKSDEYYVKMANAWLLSICYIKYPKETKTFFLNNHLDNWTHNKAIQKACESLRISKEEKKELKKLKRH